MQYRFTNDWFSQHTPVWKEKLSGFAGMKNMRALEVGSFEGRSAVWMLENLLTDSGSHLTCVDTFEFNDESRDILEKLKMPVPENPDIEAMFDANVRATGCEKRVTKIKDVSTQALRSLPLDSFDLIYIDGSHTARNVLTDAVLCWDLLKLNGVMILNNYRVNPSPEDPLMGPQKAIDAFMLCFDGEFVTVFMDRQVILRKTRNIRKLARSLSNRDT